MSWMAKLYETYEAGILLDLPESDQLMPISHTLQNAHIKITIDSDGNFKRAEVLEKTQIVLPATEKSAGRSSGEAPHPLADKIQYTAKDYSKYGGKKPGYFDGYLKQLDGWCSSTHTHPKAQAVKKYVEKGTVVQDMINNMILVLDNGGKLLCPTTDNLKEEFDNNNIDRPKIFGVINKDDKTKRYEQGNALVCWSVEEKQGDPVSDTWKDHELQKAWVDYELANSDQTGLCYITGKETPLAVNHPAKLRHTGDRAKLVSSNDMSGYTFRGRFTDSQISMKKQGAQSVGISFDVTQKAHNALRWLISRQGFRNGDQALVAWAVSGTELPQPMEDVWDHLDDEPQEISTSLPEVENKIDHTIDLGQSFANKLSKYMAGYQAKLKETDSIIIMGLDSTNGSNGRMAVTYYQEFFPKEYIERITQWHNDFAWYQRHTIEEEVGKSKPVKTIWSISAPPPRTIWEATYGKQITDSLKKSTVERILPCIIEARPFPRDLVNKAIQRAGNRSVKRLSGKYSTWKTEKAAWESDMCVACALFRGFSKRNPNQTKEYDMALEENRATRDYLYGRLLAIAERIEEMAMIVSKEKVRTTHASRLMQRFSDYPVSTWLTIEKGINPYQQRLKSKNSALEGAYKRLLDDVCDAFEADEFITPEKLLGEYLLGYHCQRKWLSEHKLKEGKWVAKIVDDKDELQIEGAEE